MEVPFLEAVDKDLIICVEMHTYSPCTKNSQERTVFKFAFYFPSLFLSLIDLIVTSKWHSSY